MNIDERTQAYAAKLKEARDRRAKALELHMAGQSKKEIGEAMGGISRQRVEKLISMAIKEQQPG